ncbi:PREDICTED: circadian clock-controlled protein-like [Wasmannia auropunctata]|uniref:circadian clock-controlled protein-like n=1 Tax=Wasmannia auropunctata TaxID=64793 RepID=UPI0005F09F97|nr:PREDICTED: circadian clock-controlled protein-like [Wasmannia auropunctata]XP_011690775.1 PREDICTED: circadian clock-controlled protein-like [Wasmannia auropunctata]XP_011690776.1 PREDICTED: circadian clock-controlled protein-like [Wasmannia auropunctata]
MSFYALVLFCATAFVLAAAQDLELPVQTCNHDADDYSSCLRLALQEAWPNFIQGIPKLDIPVLDPYFIEEQRTMYETQELKADITVTNVNVYGLAKAQFKAVRPQHSDNFFKLELDADLPKALIEGNYKAEGQVGAMQIGGHGFFNISMEDIKSTWILEGPVANDRWTLEHFQLNPEVGKMQIWFSDMFNGNEELNNAAMKFVNEYWPTLYRQMLPFLTKSWDERLTEIGNRVLSKISFSKTFP